VAYVIRYLRRAREEADHWRATYGQSLAKAFNRWIVLLANAAEEVSEVASVDALEILERAMREGDQPVPSQWKYSWEKLRNANRLEMLRALLVVLKKRCPPWEFRMSSNWFSLLDSIAVEIQTYYVVDRPNRRIIFHLLEMNYRKPQQE